MERYAPTAKDMARRDVVCRTMTVEILEDRVERVEQLRHVMLNDLGLQDRSLIWTSELSKSLERGNMPVRRPRACIRR